MKEPQRKLMLVCPMTGKPEPYPSDAAQWRKYHGEAAWLYNPWTTLRRDARDVGTDTTGLLIDDSSDEGVSSDYVTSLVRELSRLKYATSYNESYFGEPVGALKRAIREWFE